MLPFPQLPNTNIEPARLINPVDVRYRGTSSLGSANRQASLGSEYAFTDKQWTELQFLDIGNYYQVQFPSVLNSKLYLRFKANGTYNYCALSTWQGSSSPLNLNLSTNTWITVEVQYGATETSTHTWIVNGIVRYQGPRLSALFFQFRNTTLPNLVEFDFGNKGGVLPNGCKWWLPV